MGENIFDILEHSTEVENATTDGIFSGLDSASGVSADIVDTGAGGAMDGLLKTFNTPPTAPSGGGQPTTPTTDPTQQPAAQPAQTAATTTMTPGGYAMGVDMYITILEQVTSLIAKWWAKDDSEDFLFEKSLKKSYREIAIKYAETANIVLSPGMMFLFATLVIVGATGIKSHRKRNENARLFLKRQEAQRKLSKQAAGTQTELFKDHHFENKKGFRKDYKFDEEDFYVKDEQGNYIKKELRKDKVTLEVKAFVREYWSKNGANPDNKTITEYLRNL
jgi:hypothetical protein